MSTRPGPRVRLRQSQTPNNWSVRLTTGVQEFQIFSWAYRFHYSSPLQLLLRSLFTATHPLAILGLGRE